MQLKPAHAKLSGYFNDDNGSGKIRGVYLQGNDAMRPVFEAWFAPFKDLGVYHHHAFETPAVQITSLSTRWACQASSSYRMSWSTSG